VVIEVGSEGDRSGGDDDDDMKCGHDEFRRDAAEETLAGES